MVASAYARNGTFHVYRLVERDDFIRGLRERLVVILEVNQFLSRPKALEVLWRPVLVHLQVREGSTVAVDESGRAEPVTIDAGNELVQAWLEKPRDKLLTIIELEISPSLRLSRRDPLPIQYF